MQLLNVLVTGNELTLYEVYIYIHMGFYSSSVLYLFHFHSLWLKMKCPISIVKSKMENLLLTHSSQHSSFHLEKGLNALKENENPYHVIPM